MSRYKIELRRIVYRLGCLFCNTFTHLDTLLYDSAEWSIFFDRAGVSAEPPASCTAVTNSCRGALLSHFHRITIPTLGPGAAPNLFLPHHKPHHVCSRSLYKVHELHRHFFRSRLFCDGLAIPLISCQPANLVNYQLQFQKIRRLSLIISLRKAYQLLHLMLMGLMNFQFRRAIRKYLQHD